MGEIRVNKGLTTAIVAAIFLLVMALIVVVLGM
jgi:hypothetical protein